MLVAMEPGLLVDGAWVGRLGRYARRGWGCIARPSVGGAVFPGYVMQDRMYTLM